jgi:hypothetical protein
MLTSEKLISTPDREKTFIIHCLCNIGSLLSVFIQKCTLYAHTMYIHAKKHLYRV